MKRSWDSAFSLYELLGVKPTATSDEIRAAHKACARRLHPDVCDAPNAQTMMMLVNAAVDVLTSEVDRRAYDRNRELPPICKHGLRADAAASSCSHCQTLAEELARERALFDRVLRQRSGSAQDSTRGSPPCCPLCGTPMVKRRRNSDLQPFWGCAQFPTCCATIPAQRRWGT